MPFEPLWWEMTQGPYPASVPPWPILHPTTPRKIPYFWAWGGHLHFQRPLAPLTQSRAFGPPPLIGDFGLKWHIWTIWAPYGFYDPWDQLDPFWPNCNGAKSGQGGRPETNLSLIVDINKQIPKASNRPKGLKPSNWP
ncbi:hypothetical protein O181_031146 [Austropuccinia psidii MF-1]|uniref:Uncharacterized protein n=1 Tax=Austropuccinia psidii MF-1 TaxID=1389203 RepID=A0A9Q3CUA2_9BASI|nr:hypothetical protein [Austropuccinia psidii MF-1]